MAPMKYQRENVLYFGKYLHQDIYAMLVLGDYDSIL